LIGPADTRRIFFKQFRELAISKYRAGTMRLPSFCPDSPEDSLFLPRCGHAVRSHFALGLANGEIAK
jgi:hypothetical protein